ncbi:MAG: hypothetical protein ACM336_22350 [Acidobacteriota bacterium]
MSPAEEIEAARELLLAPSVEALDRSREHLERAVAGLRLDPDRAREEGVRQGVIRVTRLLESAARFRAGWWRLAAEAACGYRPTGEPAGAAPERPNLLIEG